MILKRAIRLLLNTLLIASICIQALVIALQFNDFSLDVPDFVIKKIHQELKTHHLTYQSKKTQFSLKGHLYLEDFKLLTAESLNPIVETDSLKISLNPLKLLLGDLGITHISLDNAQVIPPPHLSLDGTNTPIIHNLYAKISPRSNHIHQIDYLQCIIKDTQVAANGQFISKQSSEQLSISKTIQGLTQALQSESILQHLHNHTLYANLSVQNNTQFIKLLGNSTTASLNNFNAYNLVYSSKFQINDNTLLTEDPLLLNFDLLDSAENISLSSINALITPQPSTIITEAFNYPQSINLSCRDIHYNTLKLDYININSNFTSNNTINSTVLANSPSLNLNANIHTDLSKKSSKILTQGSTQVELISNASKLSFILPQGNTNWLGSLLVDHSNIKSPKLLPSKLSLQGSNIQLKSLPIHSFITQASIDNTQIAFNNTQAQFNPNNYATGSVHINLNNYHARYIAQGSINPSLLDGLLNDTWKSIWKPFSFNHSDPSANIDINHDSIFGSASAYNFAYNNQNFDSAKTRIHKTPTTFKLKNLKVLAQKNKAQGSLIWSSNNNESPFNQLKISANSTLPISHIKAFANSPTLDSICELFSQKSAPTLLISGSIPLGDNSKSPPLHIDFNQPTPLSLYNLPLDRLQFNAVFTPQTTTINNINYGFAQGNATATALISQNQHSDSYNLTLTSDLFNAKQSLATSHLASFTSTKKPENSNNQSGDVSLNFSTSGTIGNLSSFSGNGKIQVTNADFGKVNLLGPLSQILSLTPFGFGSFQLNQAASDFNLSNSTLFFPNLVVSGPTLTINSKGTLHIPTQNLDFILNIQPLKDSGKIPVIKKLPQILNPITQSIQVRLTGTPDQPNWNTSLKPLSPKIK